MAKSKQWYLQCYQETKNGLKLVKSCDGTHTQTIWAEKEKDAAQICLNLIMEDNFDVVISNNSGRRYYKWMY